MSNQDIENRLEQGKTDTGIPIKELRRMCISEGLTRLEAGQLVVVKKPAKKEEQK